MPAQAPIGVLGGSGQVGRAVVRQLRHFGVPSLRVGARRPDAGRHIIDRESDGTESVAFAAVDVFDPDTLSRFCDGCEVVINCAGPSCHVGDRVARAAFAAGASYVDPSGDDVLFSALSWLEFAAAGQTAMISAGMMPGLTALLPRYLAADGFDRSMRLVAYAGGRGHFTVAAAADYLATMVSGYGVPAAAWRHGARQPHALDPLVDVELPAFQGRVTAMPYLSTETERLAQALGLAEVRWFSVFDGTHMMAALRRHKVTATGLALLAAADELCSAAELDLFGRQPYQAVVMQLQGEAGGRPRTRTLMLRASCASELTGTFAALAAWAVLQHEVPAGLHHAGEVLDPVTTAGRLCHAAAAPAVELSDAPILPGPAEFQEGRL